MAGDTGLIDRVAIIGRTTLFSGLRAKDLQRLADRAVERRLVRGEVLFSAGEEARGLFVIAEGAVRAFHGNARREQVMYVERPPATIGEVAVFDGGAYNATAAADDNAIVLFLNKEAVLAFLCKYPMVAMAALALLARRVRHNTALLESLTFREVGQRLGRFLLAEARARGRRGPAGMEVILELSNQQIAARLGTVREVIWRTLKRLEQQQLIVMAGRRLIVRDQASLELFCREEARSGEGSTRRRSVSPPCDHGHCG